MVAHTFDSSIRKVEAGVSLGVQDQPGRQVKTSQDNIVFA